MRTKCNPSYLRDLPIVKLTRDYEAHAGLVGIDANATLIAEAGEDMDGYEYVSVIATARQLTPKVRRQIADKMISLWNAFAEGHKP